MKKNIFFTFLLLFGVFGLLQAQQFSYQPISPFFGNPNAFNYQQILEQFAENVNAQILSQLSRSLTAAQVDALNFDEPGTFTAGEFAIEIFEGIEGLVINILDTTTGEESQIIVPN